MNIHLMTTFISLLIVGLVASGIAVRLVGATGVPDYVVVAGSSASSTLPSTTGTTAISTALNAPSGVAVDSLGNSIICDTANNEIEVLALSEANPGYVLGAGAQWTPGELYVVAGAGDSPTFPSISGSAALTTGLVAPQAVAVDSEGNILVTDSGNDLVAVIAVSATNPGYAVSAWSRGDIYAIGGDATSNPTATSSGSSATTVGLSNPDGIAVDKVGDVVIADTLHSEIDVVAVSPTNPGYVLGSTTTWTPGDLYLIAGGGSSAPSYSGTDASAASFRAPEGLAVAPDGNVVFADERDNEVDLLAISAVNPGFQSITTWNRGDVYIIAGGGSNSTTTSGLTAAMVSLNGPTAVSVDDDGDVLIANTYANEVDLLAENATNPGYPLGSSSEWDQDFVYRLVGGGSSSPSLSGGSADSVSLSDPEGVAVGPTGFVLVADSNRSEIDQLDIAPNAPTLTSVSVSTDSVTATWLSPTEDGGDAIMGYNVLVLDGSSTPVGSATVSNDMFHVTVTGLASGETYELEVEALNAVGVGCPSTQVVFSIASVSGGQPASQSAAVEPSQGHSSAKAKNRHLDRLRILSVRRDAANDFVLVRARCIGRTCRGVVVLRGTNRAGRTTQSSGISSVQTFIAGASHFSLARDRIQEILVPLTAYARKAINDGSAVRWTASVTVGSGRARIFLVVLRTTPRRAR